jgi:hypothetical protein
MLSVQSWKKEQMKMKFINPFKKTQNSKIAMPVMHVVVKRYMENITAILAEFDVTQDSEHGFNPIITNADENFKEELNFVEEEVIAHLKYKLDLSNATDKVATVKRKIHEQEDIVKNIKDGKIEGTTYNIIDEETKLTVYKALLFSVQNAGEGSFEIIRTDGMRQIEFAFIDGNLYPIFHNATKLTTHPNIVTKKKFHREEQFLIDLERQEELSNPWGSLFTNILKGAIPVLIIVLLLLVNNTNKFASDVDARMEPLRANYNQCIVNLGQCRGDFYASNCSLDYNDMKYGNMTIEEKKTNNLDNFIDFTDRVTGGGK